GHVLTGPAPGPVRVSRPVRLDPRRLRRRRAGGRRDGRHNVIGIARHPPPLDDGGRRAGWGDDPMPTRRPAVGIGPGPAPRWVRRGPGRPAWYLGVGARRQAAPLPPPPPPPPPEHDVTLTSRLPRIRELEVSTTLIVLRPVELRVTEKT